MKPCCDCRCDGPLGATLGWPWDQKHPHADSYKAACETLLALTERIAPISWSSFDAKPLVVVNDGETEHFQVPSQDIGRFIGMARSLLPDLLRKELGK